ncbi:MAG: ribosome biogenesis GTPase Der [candidate division WOR-3 bacterium]
MKKIPFFVIIGRVNVGKSTLFNSIVGKNIAVTHRLPGITRDILRKRVVYDDNIFEVCDTGGLFGPEDELKEEVKSKVFKIIDEADLFLFVVDAKEGLTEGDKEIMNLLRTKNKPIYLIINKIDAKDKNLLDFYELSIPQEKIFKISATQKWGISELIESLIKEFPCKESEEKKIPVTIIGRPNVGKSSLLNSLIGEDYAIVSPVPGTTRDPVEAFKDEFIFIDTAGIRKKFNNDLEYFSYVKTSHSIDYSLIVIFVIDIREPFTKIERKIFSLIEEKGKGIIIALNKIDLLKEKEIEKIYKDLKEIYPYISYVPIILVSAKEKLGIDTLYLTIRNVWKEMNRVIKKSFLKKFLSKVVKENPPPFFIKDIREKSKIPRVYEVISEDYLPTYYIRYIKNQLRKDFGLMGVPLKILNTLY